MINLTGDLDMLYKTRDLDFEGTSRGQEILEDHRSPLRPDQASVYAPGIGQAVYRLLTGTVQLATTPDHVLHVSDTGLGISASRHAHPGHRVWAAHQPDTRAILTAEVALAEAVTGVGLPETGKALSAFVQALTRLGLKYPMPKTALTAATRSLPVRGLLHRLADTLDAEVRQDEDLDVLSARTSLQGQPFKGGPTEAVNLAALLHPPRTRPVHSTPAAVLRRLTRRGGAALLVGPPGTFKTETGKRVAVEEGLTLIIAKGAPGVEDRDFLGGVYPTAGGPQWVDGPISRAFLAAAQGRTLLLIDEVLRYHPEALNVLIGAMDTVSTEEAVAVGLPADTLVGERHHLLPLPNGDHLVCSAVNLTWVMTTNLGEDHLQTADRLDAALLSRIDHVIDFMYPEEETARALYTQIGGSERLSDLVYRTELVTRDALTGAGVQPVRALDARKSIAMLKEVRALLDEGLEEADALLCAFQTIALPHCCARDAAGRLEEDAVEMLTRRVIEEVLEAA